MLTIPIQQSTVNSAAYVADQHQINVDRMLDSEIRPKHLGQMADSMCEWEGRIADELMLTPAETKTIKENCKNNFNLQK